MPNRREDSENPLFQLEKHVKFLKRTINCMPAAYVGYQTSRTTALFFLLGGLDILGKLDDIVPQKEKNAIVEWIYTHQLKSLFPHGASSPTSAGGIAHHHCEREKGGAGLSEKLAEIGHEDQPCQQSAHESPLYDKSHLAQVYTALCCLLILGDDLSQVDVEGVLSDLSKCQLKRDGSLFSFCALPASHLPPCSGRNSPAAAESQAERTENDMRFIFCAVSICYLLGNAIFSSHQEYIDVDALCGFIQRSVNYDGGIGQAPGLESHGGSTFCAIASLAMLGRLWNYSVLSKRQLERLKEWALLKQGGGFHGRTGKPDDSCYSLWLGATLHILNAHQLIDSTALRRHLMVSQDFRMGGFSKHEDSPPSDLLHTFFSLAALSLLGEPGLEPVCAELGGLSQRARGHLVAKVWPKL